MTLNEFHTYQEQTFHSYITTLIRNESKDAKKAIARRAKHEVSFSQLTMAEQENLIKLDAYDFESVKSMTFLVGGKNLITIHDLLLGQAIATLPPQRRDIVLLSYFLGQHDPQIAEKMHLGKDAVFKSRHTALRCLKELLEDLDYER